jgi:hypothetical protein
VAENLLVEMLWLDTTKALVAVLDVEAARVVMVARTTMREATRNRWMASFMVNLKLWRKMRLQVDAQMCQASDGKLRH